jgi:hypothetical protein
VIADHDDSYVRVARDFQRSIVRVVARVVLMSGFRMQLIQR